MEGETAFAIVVGVALAAFSLLTVCYAFLRGKSVTETRPGRNEDWSDGSGDIGLDSIYDSIDTLELEYQLGNVPEEQYVEQLHAYRIQAASAVKRLIESGLAGPEIALEGEILEARAALEDGPVSACPECGLHAAADARSCPGCGALLAAQGRDSRSG